MGTVKTKKIQTTNFMKKMLNDYYLDLDQASNTSDKKVAWCSSAGPTELLRAFGFSVYYPENHTAILGASRTANDYIPLANSAGFSPEICSYLTSDIGAFLGNFTPLTNLYSLGKVPKPDVLVYNTNQCRDVQDWFRFYSDHFNVPLLGIQPPSFLPEVSKHDVDNVVSQFKNMIPSLEKITDQAFELNQLIEILKIAKESAILWLEVLNTAQNRPSPLSFFDGCIQMGPIVVLRGDPVVIDYYNKLKAELEQRIENNEGAVENEEIRLYWDGMPIWGKLRSLSNHFTQLRSSVVASTYCNSWAFNTLDPKAPFESMALSYTQIFINRAEDFKQNYMEKLVKQFKIDGIIFHDSKTCPNNSNNRYRLPQRLQESINIPFITIDGDQNDLRCFSEEQSKTSIEAFIEQLHN
ncbi:MAG: 2-hydroxyacyl-CoA dehydratase subunit D [Candidatus Hodarchaeales archaeon]|jgi:benzoyl-CoA reductase/2-hydroxyglutaryl-CoA dehydratase subunit BcrC/BadD/HgdB